MPIIQLLPGSGAGVIAEDYEGGLLLHYSVKGGYELAVRLLLSQGANTSMRGHSRRMVLHWAARGRRIFLSSSFRRSTPYVEPMSSHVIKLLLKKGIDVDVQSEARKVIYI